jgi:hypothetical protein
MPVVGYCAPCDEEFRPEIARCSDCGGPLRRLEEGEGRKASSVAGEASGAFGEDRSAFLDEAPLAALQLLTVAPSMDGFERVAEALGGDSIPFRVSVQNGAYAIYVLAADAEAGARALAAGTTSEADSVAGEPGPDETAAGFDPVTGSYARCPACHEEVPGGVALCPGCHLQLGDEN